ncbi:C45 family peptidase [Flavobacterium sp. J372]|uniref:C45 family autoproteolytic acyltransferase/hydolase n=1 Tax=Flavobacterium sp. J372 TaxID=2898436 RepID=UPI002150798C|nr:C45 family peptidase [Flavobacterium sp. J372]MCR5861386.1 C45 family peptidase [Flavobacterium sp. J372]
MLKRIYILLLVFTAMQLASCGTYKSIHHKPVTEGYNATVPVVEKVNDSTFISGRNSLTKNEQGQWELYIEGDPLQRGLVNGALTQSLMQKQEHAFLGKVQELVPSKFKQSLLRQFLKWYNRKLYLHVPEEYKTEIYGLSQYMPDDFDNVAPPYLRALYLHAAHDIGHALNDLALVGCTSFAAWGNKTEDGSLLLARNLDFYAGDEFAEDKVIAFVKPDKGYPYMSVVWGGFIGNLSGMNYEGLTVTINAGKSDVPLIAKTPISLLSREILQYAKNIDEAIAIAKKREVFVSESIMVGSANDKRAVLIEVSPEKFGVYDVVNSTQLICSNHFQSDTYKDDKNNTETIRDSHSEYRYERMEELLEENNKVGPEEAAEIMRNREGLSDLVIGYGNEKAINQLLAHHTVIFKPEQKQVWVSSNPYNLGEFTGYDLDEIFSSRRQKPAVKSLQEPLMLLPEDEFKYSEEFKNYEEFRKLDRVIDKAVANDEKLPSGFIETYQSLNPEHWKVYYSAGLYFYKKGYLAAARQQFSTALIKEITTLPARENIEGYLRKLNRKTE